MWPHFDISVVRICVNNIWDIKWNIASRWHKYFSVSSSRKSNIICVPLRKRAWMYRKLAGELFELPYFTNQMFAIIKLGPLKKKKIFEFFSVSHTCLSMLVFCQRDYLFRCVVYYIYKECSWTLKNYSPKSVKRCPGEGLCCVKCCWCPQWCDVVTVVTCWVYYIIQCAIGAVRRCSAMVVFLTTLF